MHASDGRALAAHAHAHEGVPVTKSVMELYSALSELEQRLEGIEERTVRLCGSTPMDRVGNSGEPQAVPNGDIETWSTAVLALTVRADRIIANLDR